jgi:hypothetical protein
MYTNVGAILEANAGGVLAINVPDTADRATAFNGLIPPERYVQALYLDDLGRPASITELSQWLTVLSTPGNTRQTVASAIANSAEARGVLVRSWYLSFLGRQAVGGEEQGSVNRLLNGETEESVLSNILSSPEFYQHAQTLFSTGTPNERFVLALYQLLLNRSPSTTEAASWVSTLPTQGRQGVALAFLTSSEFRQDQFEGYYNVLLHRMSDPGGPAFFDTTGQSLEAVRIDFETSNEFFAVG